MILLVLFVFIFASYASSSESFQIEWYAPFLSGGGYSSEAVAFVMALAKRGQLSLKIEQHGDGLNADFVNGLPRSEQELLGRLFAPSYFNRLLPTITVCHSEPGAWNVMNGPLFQTTNCPRTKSSPRNFVVGRTMFEADGIPIGWKERLNTMDEIWVPTEFHRLAFENAGVQAKKLWVVAEPVDTEFFDPERSTLVKTDYIDRAAVATAERPFVFLSVFKWEERKGWRYLLKAFIQEFQNDDNVILAILTNAYHSSSKVFNF